VMTRDIVHQETVLLVAWSISQSKTRWGIAITSMSPVIGGVRTGVCNAGDVAARCALIPAKFSGRCVVSSCGLRQGRIVNPLVEWKRSRKDGGIFLGVTSLIACGRYSEPPHHPPTKILHQQEGI
jgi:hypothetical protein